MTTQDAPAAVDIDKLYATFVEKYRAKRAALGAGDSADLTDNEVAQVLAELGDEFIGNAVAELLQEMPEASQLSPVDLSNLVAEALAESIVEATS